MTGLIYHKDYLRHNTGPHHPERPSRLTAIIRQLERGGLLSKLINITPFPATIEQLSYVHSQAHIEKVKNHCENGHSYLDADTIVSKDSFDIACLAAGGVLAACDAIMKKQVDNAFCAVRPPGHHALPDRSMGFCIFNNVAIGAMYLKNTYRLRRILIVDWDAHHGNGTQDIFYDDPSVLYFSIHQYPHYPGSGSNTEKGKGAGSGFTLNLPMQESSGDKEYIQAFQEHLIPLALSFKPDFIFISAGFDCHKDDPLADLEITEDGFGKLTQIVNNIAKECCDRRLVSVLEGGYNLRSLAHSVEAHIYALIS